jgi:predicted RND superfamily exporter protein
MLDKNYESQVHVGKTEEPRKGPSIAFGLERIGLFAVKAPIVSMMVLAALLVAAVFGVYRIKIDDSLSQLFRSNSKDYKQYEAVTKRFPATEFDVLVVVEGKTLLARDNLEKVRDMVTDLQLVEGVRADQKNKKSTFPTVLGLDKSRAYTSELIADAHEQLRGFGSKAEPLRAIADFFLTRKH